MTDEALRRAFRSTRAVLADVGPAVLGDPTPCRSWNVGELINHVVAAPRFGVRALRGELLGDETDYAHGDFLAAYDASTEEALATFADPGVLDQMVTLPFAEVPGAFLRMMITTDQFAHGWDLARATGQSTDLDRDLAVELMAEAAIPAEFRGEDGVAPFGPEQRAPDTATAADKLAAYLGRTA